METFNANKQLAKVTAGFRGGPFFKSPSSLGAKRFEDGWPRESRETAMLTKVSAGKPLDVWNARRSNGSI